jgi:hypothetical protein
MQALCQLAQFLHRSRELILAARDLVRGLPARRAQPAPVQCLLHFREPAFGSVVQTAFEPLTCLIAGLQDAPA